MGVGVQALEGVWIVSYIIPYDSSNVHDHGIYLSQRSCKIALLDVLMNIESERGSRERMDHVGRTNLKDGSCSDAYDESNGDNYILRVA